MRVFPFFKIFNFNKLNIRQKFLGLYVLAFIVPLMIITVILSKWISKTLTTRQFALIRTSLAQTSSLISSMLESSLKLSESLFANRTVNQILEYRFKSTQEVYSHYATLSFLQDLAMANPDVLNFVYYTENQTMVDNSYFIRVTQELQDSNWYKAAVAAEGREVWVIKNVESYDTQTLSLVRALFNKTTGEVLGVLSVHLDNLKIEEILSAHNDETLVLVDSNIAFSSMPLNPSEKLSIATTLSNGDFKPEQIIWHGKESVVMLNGLYNSKRSTITLAQIIPQSDFTKPSHFVILLCLLITGGGSILSLSLLQLFSHHITKRVDYLQNQINRIVQNNFEVGPRLSGSDEFAQIYDALVITSNNIKKLIDEVYRHKIKQEQLLARQNDIRFKMLSSQINPHFLFNALETIRMQAIDDDNKQVANTIKLLAKILRHNLSISNSPVSLMSEIEAVNNYLAIQHLRFADRVSYSINFLAEVKNALILPLLIQPLVENSFTHGLQDKKIDGFIIITIDLCDEKKNFLISIKDNGCGIPEEKFEAIKTRLATGTVENLNTSIGMVNVNQRVKLFYGQEYGLEIESKPNEGTLVMLKIPAVYTYDEEEKNGGTSC